MAKRRLGRGLGALIHDEPPPEGEEAVAAGDVMRVPRDRIRPCPWQPRKSFEPDSLEELVQSVRAHGVLQPLLVREREDHLELIAGERRLRAAELAGLDEVPVIPMEVPDQEALELALVENLQREDLNAVEEAEGYRALMETFELTQEQAAERVGKGRATVANALRLLALPDPVKQRLAEGGLSPGHAKVLLSLEIPEEQTALAEQVVRDRWSVRDLEKQVKARTRPPRKPRAEREDIPPEHLRDLSERLYQRLGTSVRVVSSKTLANGKKARGRVEIDFYSPDDLDRLVEILGLGDDL